MEYNLVRSCRKTLSLQVKSGQIYVRAPYHVDEQYIDSFIKKKKAWLKAKISEQNQTVDLCCDFTQGANLFLFGQLVSLNIVAAQNHEKSGVELTQTVDGKQALTVRLSAHIQAKSCLPSQRAVAVKNLLECFLAEQANIIIPPKVSYYSKLTRLNPTSIKIKKYTARWGSCNNKGELSFNYLLMMLPLDVIDYVIVHELCHLQHLNHSKDFWQLVTQYYPQQLAAKQWIKTHQSALHWRVP
jgi:predicted metal-dependent hydrolase